MEHAAFVGVVLNRAHDRRDRAVGERIYSGAATRKMLLVTAALRSVGHLAAVVSLPFVGTKAARAGYRGILQTEQGVPVAFLPTLRSKYFRKVVGPLVLACFAARRVRRGDTVILYNHAIELLPALAILRLKGRSVVHDIEDAPNPETRGIRRLMSRVSFFAIFRFTRSRKMVVSEEVARLLDLDDYVVVRGVARFPDADTRPMGAARWEELRGGGDLRLHFGGSLVAANGVDLFCEAIALLAESEDRMSRPVTFTITGVGDMDKIRDAATRIQGRGKLKVEILPELSVDEFVEAISHCHGALSLRRPGAGNADTTFPSKVIEITAAGMALVSTRLGDVAEIYDRSAYFLDDYSPRALAEIIVAMSGDTDGVARVAEDGFRTAKRHFSLVNVGNQMTRLFQE